MWSLKTKELFETAGSQNVRSEIVFWFFVVFMSKIWEGIGFKGLWRIIQVINFAFPIFHQTPADSKICWKWSWSARRKREAAQLPFPGRKLCWSAQVLQLQCLLGSVPQRRADEVVWLQFACDAEHQCKHNFTSLQSFWLTRWLTGKKALRDCGFGVPERALWRSFDCGRGLVKGPQA